MLHQRAQHRLHLESGESLPGAGMCAVPEAEMAGALRRMSIDDIVAAPVRENGMPARIMEQL